MYKTRCNDAFVITKARYKRNCKQRRTATPAPRAHRAMRPVKRHAREQKVATHDRYSEGGPRSIKRLGAKPRGLDPS